MPYSETRRCQGPYDLIAKLSAMARKSGYKVLQLNGQRVYALSSKMPPPPRGSEVFIRNLPQNIYEDELVPLFESVGRLYQFRLMLNFNCGNRGFAFATYFSKTDADSAMERLHGYEVRRGLHIGVLKSVDNRRLFIGSLPFHVTSEELKELLQQYVDGVVDVTVQKDHTHPHLNRGFAFAEFEDHGQALKAKKKFTPKNLIGWDKRLYVDWAKPLPEVDPKIMAKVCVLYLKNLPIEHTSEEIRIVLGDVVGPQLITKVHKTRNYAFVHFVSRCAAKFAFKKLPGLTLTDSLGYHRTAEVEWARPTCFSNKSRSSTPPENSYMSIPSNMEKFQKTDEARVPINISTDLGHNCFARPGPRSIRSRRN